MRNKRLYHLGNVTKTSVFGSSEYCLCMTSHTCLEKEEGVIYRAFIWSVYTVMVSFGYLKSGNGTRCGLIGPFLIMGGNHWVPDLQGKKQKLGHFAKFLQNGALWGDQDVNKSVFQKFITKNDRTINYWLWGSGVTITFGCSYVFTAHYLCISG